VGYLVVSRLGGPVQSVSLAVAFLVSVVVSTAAERLFAAHDPLCVVIDEVWGMWAVMTAVPLVCQVPWLAALAFGLFRVFDIAKPPPLKWLARAPGGLGIVLDDAGAAAYTVGALWFVVMLTV
jgi:phosphatidylglycerophosphatase A